MYVQSVLLDIIVWTTEIRRYHGRTDQQGCHSCRSRPTGKDSGKAHGVRSFIGKGSWGQVFHCSVLAEDQPLTPYLSTICGNPQLSTSACDRTSQVLSIIGPPLVLPGPLREGAFLLENTLTMRHDELTQICLSKPVRLATISLSHFGAHNRENYTGRGAIVKP